MKKRVLLITAAIASVWMIACGQPKQEETEVTESQEVSEETMEEVQDGHYGKIIDSEGAKTVDEFASLMEGKDSLRIKIQTVARDVCQKKGCWMKVETADGSLMRVRFKDYGFFVPKDIGGKTIVFEGVAFRDTVSVEDLKHYAEDGGKSEEEIAAITQPEINTAFLADGVVVIEE